MKTRFLFAFFIKKRVFLIPLLFCCNLAVFAQQARTVKGIDAIRDADHKLVKKRSIAIDNVCAWPNLSMLRDGTVIATIFNKPSHGLIEGDVECWASKDGVSWKKQGSPAMHDLKNTNRMNVAAGLAMNGDLVVLTSGWLLEPSGPPNPAAKSVLRAWISRSSDAGKTWTVDKKSFPMAEPGRTHTITYGDIVPGLDGSLRATGYSLAPDRKRDQAVMFRSKDDGRTWEMSSIISGKSNEVAPYHLGNGKWIALARGATQGVLDQFSSDDDGYTWKMDKQVTTTGQVPGHVLRLKDGRLLLSSGNRVKGQYGVHVRISADNGVTWGNETLLISDLTSQDSGYPSSVQLPNGDICTAYYAAGTKTHPKYHMGVIIWRLPE